MPFESLGAVSYSPFIVTMTVFVAVCEIYSVKEWRDFENQVRGHSRSLNMAPFDRPHATGLEVIQGHWNWCHSKAWVQFPIRLL